MSTAAVANIVLLLKDARRLASGEVASWNHTWEAYIINVCFSLFYFILFLIIKNLKG